VLLIFVATASVAIASAASSLKALENRTSLLSCLLARQEAGRLLEEQSKQVDEQRHRSFLSSCNELMTLAKLFLRCVLRKGQAKRHDDEDFFYTGGFNVLDQQQRLFSVTRACSAVVFKFVCGRALRAIL
jgi:hypothetical protein